MFRSVFLIMVDGVKILSNLEFRKFNGISTTLERSLILLPTKTKFRTCPKFLKMWTRTIYF